MVAVALPTKAVINRLFELSNEPCGHLKIWLQNIGLSKILAGKISWYYAKPGQKVIAWKRLMARYDREADLLLVHLLTGPVRILWSIVRGRSASLAPAPTCFRQ